MYGRKMIQANKVERVFKALAPVRVTFWQTPELSITDSATPVFVGKSLPEATYSQATAPMLCSNTTYKRVFAAGEELWASCQDQAYVHFIAEYWPYEVPRANVDLLDVREVR